MYTESILVFLPSEFRRSIEVEEMSIASRNATFVYLFGYYNYNVLFVEI